MTLKLNPEVLSKVALLLHRQNPRVLSVEAATQHIERDVARVQEKGRASGEVHYTVGTAGYNVVWTNYDGLEEIDVTLSVVSLWSDDNGGTTAFEWGSLDLTRKPE